MSQVLQSAAPTQRRIPSVERLLGHPDALPLAGDYGRSALTEAIRADLARIRSGEAEAGDEAAILARCGAALKAERQPSLRPVFNLTGTVLHTNLGRALLPRSAAEAVMAVMTQATNLEFDLATGSRGERDDHIEGLIRRITGAEAAIVVNNNAAAVLLVLNALAMRKEVVVSRGELVEIGGSFRVPDVMVRAGCKLREVGTTNRTHLRDFAEAIGPATGLAMKVHPSNYAISGFTAQPDPDELHALCRERGVPLAEDLGSGSLIDLAAYGLPPEPTVSAACATNGPPASIFRSPISSSDTRPRTSSAPHRNSVAPSTATAPPMVTVRVSRCSTTATNAATVAPSASSALSRGQTDPL